jgi:hypothetical protein
MTTPATDKKAKKFDWQLVDGTIAPEWKLKLVKPLSNGTVSLTLEEPSLDQGDEARKLYVYTDESKTSYTEASANAALKRLISLITKVPEDIIGEMKQSDAIRAKLYLDSFTDFLLKSLSV